MNDLSIVFPLLVKARASTEAQHVSRARSPGPHSRPQHGPQGCAADRRSSLFISLWRIWPSGFLIDVQRFDLHTGDNAYQSRARQSFPLRRQIISICRIHKASPASRRWLAKASRQPPCVGKLSLPIIPLCSKSSLPGKSWCVQRRKNCVQKERAREGGKSNLLLLKVCSNAHTSTLQPNVSHFIISCNPATSRRDPMRFLRFAYSPQIPNAVSSLYHLTMSVSFIDVRAISSRRWLGCF